MSPFTRKEHADILYILHYDLDVEGKKKATLTHKPHIYLMQPSPHHHLVQKINSTELTFFIKKAKIGQLICILSFRKCTLDEDQFGCLTAALLAMCSLKKKMKAGHLVGLGDLA